MSGQDDEIVSLEDLVRDDSSQVATTIAGAPVPEYPRSMPEPPPNTSESEQTEAVRPQQSFAPDLGELDRVLSVEDPDFSKSLESDFKEADAPEGDAAADIEIDSLDLSEVIREANLKGWRRLLFILIRRPIRSLKVRFAGLKGAFANVRGSFRTVAKSALIAAVAGAKKAGLGAVSALKTVAGLFSDLPGASKALVFAVVGLGVVLYFVLRTTFQGHFLPHMQPPFVRSFAVIADRAFQYDPQAQLEDFNNPLLHPENVVQLEKIVVNLKSSGEGSNPMGMFELYLETATHEAAVELKDREIEARDLVARTMEQMPYDDLITFEGKEKLKNIIRTNLNTFLTQGRVRKVFFKTIVLKP